MGGDGVVSCLNVKNAEVKFQYCLGPFPKGNCSAFRVASCHLPFLYSDFTGHTSREARCHCGAPTMNVLSASLWLPCLLLTDTSMKYILLPLITCVKIKKNP